MRAFIILIILIPIIEQTFNTEPTDHSDKIKDSTTWSEYATTDEISSTYLDTERATTSYEFDSSEQDKTTTSGDGSTNELFTPSDIYTTFEIIQTDSYNGKCCIQYYVRIISSL
jgi:hypothetical protein